MMDSTKDTILKLVSSTKRYLLLQKQYVRLEMTEKLSLLLTALILGGIMLVIAIIVMLFLGLSMANALMTLVSEKWLAYLIVSLFFIVLMYVIYIKRKNWIEEPLINKITSLLKEEQNDK